MNVIPSFLNIVQGELYIIGGSSIYVLGLANLEILASYPLGNDTIHALAPAFPQTTEGEFGVWVYSWNDKRGYRKRFYSPKTGTQDGWLSEIGNTIFSKKAPRSLYDSVLKVVIPNVLGLVLLSDHEQVALFDLDSMKIIEQFSVRLTGWRFENLSRVRVKFHRNKQLSDF